MRMEFTWSSFRKRKVNSYFEEELNECGDDVLGKHRE